MSKLDKMGPKAPEGAVKTAHPRPDTETFEGATAYSRDAKSDLFLLAVVNMVGEDTFYEAAEERDRRFRELIHQVVKEDPAWIARFIPFLRNEMYMRSASIVMAAEYVRARHLLGHPEGAPATADVVASALSRADEPAEILAYWRAMYGTPPTALLKGVAKASQRLYNEFSALKYDGGTRNWRMGDVIDLAHPTPKDERQAALFKWLLDKRHNRPDPRGEDQLEIVQDVKAFDAIPAEMRREYLRTSGLPKGVTWERLSGWLPGGMDKEAWEAVIPQMGYMATIRNLRNFDDVKIGQKVVNKVIAKITDPEQVAKSKQFPFRFYSAYSNVGTERWSAALEEALDLSLQNVPEFEGRTLILIDVSASMTSMGYSRRGTVSPAIAAALFGSAVAKRSKGGFNLVAFGSYSKDISELVRTNSLLKMTELIPPMGTTENLDHGTELMPALEKHYDGHDRVMAFTDMQIFPWGTSNDPWGGRSGLTDGRKSVMKQIKRFYGFNLGGYNRTPFEMGKDGRYEMGGLTDKTFKMIELLEANKDAGWPF